MTVASRVCLLCHCGQELTIAGDSPLQTISSLKGCSGKSQTTVVGLNFGVITKRGGVDFSRLRLDPPLKFPRAMGLPQGGTAGRECPPGCPFRTCHENPSTRGKAQINSLKQGISDLQEGKRGRE